MRKIRRFLIVRTDTRGVTAALGKHFRSRVIAFSRESLDVAEVLYKTAVSRIFKGEGSPPGSWKRLHPFTVEERLFLMMEGRKNLVPNFGPKHPILQRTGMLKRSLIGGSTRYYRRKQASGGNSSITFGTRDRRFRLLHKGGRNVLGGRVPARPMLPQRQDFPIKSIIGNVYQEILGQYAKEESKSIRVV